ncbi:MAG: Glu-tRNA(Gln) amidotransferase subunit GatE [Planctomycetes bacterium]|nr:Glu-tRNA(Gln) amidotransferase subunit GatE [Planctomycetota bacterium]
MDALPLKPFQEMTSEDYAEIGLMCGLEVHQQLLTDTKLFCRCPAGHYSSDYDAEVLRHMRPTLSEMGEYDGTALMEKKTRKNITYRIHHATVCTYEFDDTPPFLINDQAVDIALELSHLLRLNLVNELHIARKQYLDGSIPTGFQRTTILGVDGWIPFKERRIDIRQLGLEEDSCREVSDHGHERTYLTDRLGMPLIEVVTEPNMFTPQETAEVCDLIRKICRSTQKVRRGYGATRQDVNVSVRGGTRIEIKGVPQIWRIPHLIYNEASRQVALLRIKDVLNARGITHESINTPAMDVTSIVAKTTWAPIKTALDLGLKVRCVLLSGFAGILNTTTQEHTTFAKEFSDRVRVIACLSQLPNIVHSDAAAESLWPQDWLKIRKRMKATENDALILVWGNDQDLDTACEEILIRAREATVGVPSDTRQPLKDGTNGFERVLPGADRMYPDTDLPPIEITADRVARTKALMPEFVWETEARFREWGNGGGMAEEDVQRLCISPRAIFITRCMIDLKLSGKLLGTICGQWMRALSRKNLDTRRFTDEALLEIFSAYIAKRMAREGIPWLIERMLRIHEPEHIKASDVALLLDEIDMKPATDEQLSAHLDRVLYQVQEENFPTAEKRVRYMMGELMEDLVGRVDGMLLLKLVNDRVSQSKSAPSQEPMET